MLLRHGKILKIAQELARVAKAYIGIMSDMVVMQVALVKIGGGRIDGLDCNQGRLLRDCAKMVVARGHGLADGGGAGHFWWRKERYDSCCHCSCVKVFVIVLSGTVLSSMVITVVVCKRTWMQ